MPRRRVAVVVPTEPMQLKLFLTNKLNEIDEALNSLPSPAFTTVGNITPPIIAFGSGTPEANLTARVGSLYMRTNGGASTTLYVKESGTGNTGWVAK